MFKDVHGINQIINFFIIFFILTVAHFPAEISVSFKDSNNILVYIVYAALRYLRHLPICLPTRIFIHKRNALKEYATIKRVNLL